MDKYHAMMGKAFTDFGIHFDIYHRTSSELHKETSQAFFLQLHKNGALTEQEEQQYYDEEARQFLADRYIKGTCPVCANPDAYGDQCEKCGSALIAEGSEGATKHPQREQAGARSTRHWYLPMERSQAVGGGVDQHRRARRYATARPGSGNPGARSVQQLA